MSNVMRRSSANTFSQELIEQSVSQTFMSELSEFCETTVLLQTLSSSYTFTRISANVCQLCPFGNM